MVQMIGEKLLIIDLFIDQSKLVGRWQKETQTKEIDCQGWNELRLKFKTNPYQRLSHLLLAHLELQTLSSNLGICQ